jgi:amidohydrolase
MSAIQQALVLLRGQLHAHPEPSGQEAGTAACLKDVLLGCRPARILTRLGGHGLAAVFTAPDDRPGPTVALRAEMDALLVGTGPGAPIARHLCGHDGHMAALCAIAMLRRERPLARGRLVLLFQPAEETGMGARAVIADPRWHDLAVDHCYAVHNLPRHPFGEVVLADGTFAAGSVELEIRLEDADRRQDSGAERHDPSLTMGRLVSSLVHLPGDFRSDRGLVLLTVTEARLAASAHVHGTIIVTIRATLCAETGPLLAELRSHAIQVVQREAHRHDLEPELHWSGEFPATENDSFAVAMVENAARRAELAVGPRLDSPLRWSEDFGWYLRETTGALVGLGAGVDHPDLHAPDYEYPDDLLAPAVDLQEALLVTLGLIDTT